MKSLGFLVIVFSFVQVWAIEPLPTDEATQIISEFQYESNYTEIDSYKDGGAFDSCWTDDKVIQTIFPKMERPLDVELRLYVPNRSNLGAKMVPTVVMIPPIGGMNFLDTQTAKTICANGMAAIILKNDFANINYQVNNELLPVSDHAQTFHRITAAIKASSALATDDPNLDHKRMGIFGVSLGGILSSFVMTTQSQFSAGYFVVAGGNLPEILAYSDQDQVSIIRRKRMEEENIQSKDEYRDYIAANLVYDPIVTAATMIPETINMVIAKRDSKVPSDNQMALHVAFGEPKASFYREGHLDTILSALLFVDQRRKVARFFKDRFSVDNPRPELFNWLSPHAIASN